MESQPVLDQNVISRIMQRPSGRQLLALYVAETSGLLQGLATAVAQADTQTMWESAHSLKSSSAYVGAIQVNRLSATLEQLGRKGELAGAETLCQQLNGEFERVKESINGLGL